MNGGTPLAKRSLRYYFFRTTYSSTLLFRQNELLQTATRLAGLASRCQTAENIARIVGGQSLRPRARDKILQRSVHRAADANSVLPTRIPHLRAAAFGCFRRTCDSPAEFRIGDDERVVLQNRNAARTPEMAPFVDKAHVFIEDLDEVVGPVGNACGPMNSRGPLPGARSQQ